MRPQTQTLERMNNGIRYLKILMAICLLALLFSRIDVEEALSGFRRLDIPSMASILFVAFWLIFLSVWKWRLFLVALKLPAPFWRLYAFYLIGYFFSNFLPSNIGGDASRFMFTARGKETYADAFTAVFMERFTGIVATLLYASVALPLALVRYDLMGNFWAAVLPVLGTACLVAVLLFACFRRPVRSNPSGGMLMKIRRRLVEVLTTIGSFRDEKRLLLHAMLLSVAFNFLAIVNVYVVARALDLSVGFFSLFVFVPIILVISSIPLSINGVGVAEGAYVVCLVQAGMTAPEALSVALLMRLKNMAVSLLGGVCLLYRKGRKGDDG